MVRGTYSKILSLAMCFALVVSLYPAAAQEPTQSVIQPTQSQKSKLSVTSVVGEETVSTLAEYLENTEEAPPDVLNNPIITAFYQFLLMGYYYGSPLSWVGGGATLSLLSHHLYLKKNLKDRKRNSRALQDLTAFEKKLTIEMEKLEPIIDALQPKLDELNRLADSFAKVYLKGLPANGHGTRNFESVFELEQWLKTEEGKKFLKRADKSRWMTKYNTFKELLRKKIDAIFSDPKSGEGIDLIQQRVHDLYKELNAIARKNEWSDEFKSKHVSATIDRGDSNARPGHFIRDDSRSQVSKRLPPEDVSLQLRNQLKGCKGLAVRLSDLKSEIQGELGAKWSVGVKNYRVNVPKSPFTVTVPRVPLHVGLSGVAAGVTAILVSENEGNPLVKFVNYRRNATRADSLRIQRESQLAIMIRKDESFRPYLDSVAQAFFDTREKIEKELREGIERKETLEQIGFDKNIKAIENREVFRDHIINQIPGASLDAKAISPADVKKLFLALQKDEVNEKSFLGEDFVNKLIRSSLNKLFPGLSRTSRKYEVADFISEATMNEIYTKVIANLRSKIPKKESLKAGVAIPPEAKDKVAGTPEVPQVSAIAVQ